MDEDADWTYFALDERVCLAPCAPFIMLPMFESAARFPAGANPWLLKPIHSFARRVERASVSPLSFGARGFASINQKRTTYLLSSHQGRYAHASRFHSSFFVYVSFSPLRRISRDTHTHTSVSLHPIASHRNGVPLCDTSIHPVIHSWLHTHARASIHRRTDAHETNTYRTRRRRRRLLGSSFDARRTAVGNETPIDAGETNERTTFRASVRTPFGIRSDIWYTGCVWVFSI